MEAERRTIHIDGGCGLCNSFARFVSRRDKEGIFEFVPDNASNTVLLVEGNRTYTRSAAVLRVLGALGFPWSWFAGLGRLTPQPIRDAIYDWVARHRHGGMCRID